MIWAEALIHWLHLLAAIIWLGGMIFTAFLLNPILRARLAPEVRLPLIRAVGLRFKYVEWICLGVLLATGLEKLRQMGSWEAAFEGSYGRILTVKLWGVAGMLVLSFLHTFLWGPRLAALPPGSPGQAALTRRLVLWARVNLALGLGVVLCAALLRMNPF